MPGQINLTGANAAVQLVGNDTITTDQEFTFPDTGGTVVTDDFTGNVKINGSLTAAGQIESQSNGFKFPDGSIQTTASAGSGGTVINYNGASAWGSIADDGTINNSFNVASVDQFSQGVYDVVFTTPMPSTEYAINLTGATDNPVVYVSTQSATGFRLLSEGLNGSVANGPFFFTVHASNAIAPQAGVGADAWGSFDGNNATAVINASYNIANVVKNGAGDYNVTFIEAMPSDDYAVTTTYLSRTSSRTATGFTLQTFNFDGGAASFSDCQFAVFASSTVTPTYTWTRDGTTLKPANSGDDLDDIGNITAAGGGAILGIQANTTKSGALQLFDDSGDIGIDMAGTGSAAFEGSITAGGAIQSGGSPYSGANVGSVIENGGVVGCKSGNASLVWAGYLKDTSDPTSKIQASGQSYFRNLMEVGTTSAPTPDYCFIGHSSRDSTSDYATFYARNMNPSGRTFTGTDSNGASTFEVFGNGDITGNVTRVANVELKLDPDDPTKVLDVKESIRTVQAALYRLKAAVLIPDTTVDQLRLRILEALENITEEVEE